jgi:hypothetical protein
LKKLLQIGILFFCIIAAFDGCVNEPPQAPPKELKLEDSFLVQKLIVPVSGGAYFFNPKDTANSIRIIFPANTYSGPKNITLSVQKISGNSLSDKLNPITDLYTIEGDSEFANKNIVINFPVTLDTNNFTMAFLYDQVSREIEGLPTIGYYAKNKPKLLSITTRRLGSVFLSTIAKTKLAASVSTSFDPKLDNWEFPPEGTYITPNGQYEGQSLTAAWYFYEQQSKGSPHLYGAFDVDHGGESPKIWMDNNFGLQFAAQTHQNLNFQKTAPEMTASLNNGNFSLTINELVYSIMVTGKPQLITVVQNSTILPLIVLKVNGNTIVVAKPDLPQSSSPILTGATYIGVRAMVDWNKITKTWNDQKNGIPNSFPQYQYGLMDESGSLPSSKDGYVSAGHKVTLAFKGINPSAIIYSQNDSLIEYDPTKGILLNPGMNHIGVIFLQDLNWSGYQSITINQQAFIISHLLDSSYVENDVVFKVKFAQKPTESLRYEWNMGDGSQAITTTDIDSIKYRYRTAGKYTASLSIRKISSNTLIGTENATVIISQNPVTIIPTGISAISGASYIFYGIIKIPKDIIQRCEWDMGDGAATQKIIGADTINFKYLSAGNYTINLHIYDNATNVLLGSAQMQITVKQIPLPTLAQLQSMKFVNVEFGAKGRYQKGETDYSTGQVHYSPYDKGTGISLGLGTLSDTASQRIIWNGLTFKTAYQNYRITHDSCSGGFGISTNQSSDAAFISGSFAIDFSNLTISNSHSFSSSAQTYDCQFHWVTSSDKDNDHGFDCKNIYLVSNNNDSIIYIVSGPGIQNLVSKVSDYSSSGSQGHQGPPIRNSDGYLSTYWDDSLTIPRVKVIFRKK